MAQSSYMFLVNKHCEAAVLIFSCCKSEIIFTVWAKISDCSQHRKKGVSWHRTEKGHSATFKVMKKTIERRLSPSSEDLTLGNLNV